MTLLENDVTVLQDEVEEMETDINQLDDGLLLVEGIAVENSNDIDGDPFIKYKKMSHLKDNHEILQKSVILPAIDVKLIN